jgi:hypothetical protein
LAEVTPCSVGVCGWVVVDRGVPGRDWRPERTELVEWERAAEGGGPLIVWRQQLSGLAV